MGMGILTTNTSSLRSSMQVVRNMSGISDPIEKVIEAKKRAEIEAPKNTYLSTKTKFTFKFKLPLPAAGTRKAAHRR